MKKTVVILAAAAFASLPANARIGESIEACAARYGDPRKINLDENNTGVATYEKNDLKIKIHFTNSNADLINYSPGEVARINFETAQYLVDINGRNKEWNLLTETKIFIHDVQDEHAQKLRTVYVDPILWETKDGVLLASYSDSQGVLEIKTSMAQLKIRQGL